MSQSANLQNTFLNEIRKSRTPVTVFLTNGFQLRGMIKAFDNFTVLLEADGQQHLIYKHAISTFVPAKHMTLNEE